MSKRNDLAILRDLATQYAEAAAKPVQQERRDLWTRHNSLERTRPPILATFGMWNVWCREVFGDAAMRCEDPFYRGHERVLRMQVFQDAVGDDSIIEPWITQRAAVSGSWRGMWGVPEGNVASGVEGGAWKYDPPIKAWPDMAKLCVTPHTVDEEATARDVRKLEDAVGDILTVNVDRTPMMTSFMSDISTSLTGLRGLEQVMIDMYDAPAELHKLLAFMRDGILEQQAIGEQAGHFGLTSQSNQAMCYCRELEPPCPNSGPRLRKQLWTHCAAQEFTLISPAMHDEFLLQYQLPILRQWGLVAYGCCENLTHKIDMLRQIPNLRMIAVTPTADVARSAEQIRGDYVLSWRPNPTDMVCSDFSEPRIRRIVGEAMTAARGCRVHIHLKDVETVQGEPDRLARWVRLVREVTAGD